MADRMEVRMVGLIRAIDNVVLQEPRLFAMLGADAPPFLAQAEAHTSRLDRRQTAYAAAIEHYGGAHMPAFHLWVTCRELAELRRIWTDVPLPLQNLTGDT